MENDRLEKYFASLAETEHLSVPTKTLLLEEGKIAAKLFLIRDKDTGVMPR